MRTLLIGLDAATESVLSRLFEEEDAPALRELAASGASGTLRSQIPPWTASAWPSLYTGRNPGKHGVFGFLHFEGYDWDVVNATNVRARALWEYLDYHGLTSVVVNVPVTHPPRAFDGALVPGYAAPESPACHPEGLLEAVRDAIGEYRVYAPRDVSDRERQLEWFRRLTRMRGEAFRELAARYEPEFGFVQFQQTDTVFHERPGDFEAVRTVYRAVDEQVAAIIESCDPETVVVASDHGMGRWEGPSFRVNQFLADAGYLSETRGGRGMPTWVTVRDEQLREGQTGAADGRGVLPRLSAAAARMGLTTERVAAALETVGLAETVASYVPASVSRAGTHQVDFPASTAYVRDSIELGVRLNVEGREPDGVVPEADYEAVRSEIMAALRGVETPGGEPVFEEVAPREAYFHGPAAEDAVDVVTVPADFGVELSIRLGREQFGPVEEPWNHTLEGVIVAAGTAVDGESLAGAHLFDVAPTVLATLDLPADPDMDGEVLPVVAAHGEHTYPERTQRERQSTDDPAVERRLADLGYIE